MLGECSYVIMFVCQLLHDDWQFTAWCDGFQATTIPISPRLPDTRTNIKNWGAALDINIRTLKQDIHPRYVAIIQAKSAGGTNIETFSMWNYYSPKSRNFPFCQFDGKTVLGRNAKGSKKVMKRLK